MYGLASYWAMRAKCATRKFFTDERGEVNVVAIVVLIAVAVILAVLLKDQLTGMITKLVDLITKKSITELDL